MAVQQPMSAMTLLETHSTSPSSFRTRKSLPHPYLQSQSDKRNISAFINDERTGNTSPRSLKRTNGHSMPGSFPVINLESSLPPTPPRHTTDQSRSFSLPSTAGNQPYLPSNNPRNQNHAAYRTTRDPPTPDASPPAGAATLELPVRPTLAAFSPSSRADSFRTAREEQWASDEEADSSHIHGSFSGAVKPHRQASRDKGLGLDFERDDDSTPTPRKHKQAVARSIPQMDGPSPDSLPNREWDTNMMRNVTVRRKKRAVIPQNTVLEDEERVSARRIMPKLFNGSSEEDDTTEPLTPNHDLFALTMSSAPRSDERPKRHSGSSHTGSTILEAIIIPLSPQRRRTLRHVSKTHSLRSEDGSSRPGSNHASIAEDELSADQLNERLRTEHFKRASGICTPERLSPVTAVRLRHHPEMGSLRSASGSTTSPMSQHYRSTSGGYTSRTAHIPSNRLSFLPGSEPLNVKYDAAAKRMSVGDPAEQQMARVATRRALQRLDSSAGTLDARPTSISRIRSLSQPERPLSMRNVEHKSNEHDPFLLGHEESPSKTSGRPGRQDSIGHVDLPVLESVPRVSFDQSTVSTNTNEMHRSSDAGNLHAESEHANARHLFAQSTPFSQVSEHEIGEANAISIYPHNNNSLLVVQQVARPSGIQRHDDDNDGSEIPGWPSLTVQPATPPQQFLSAVNVDSPLRNPRQPPILPTINIHPATPASELDVSPLDEQVRPGGRLVRSMSAKAKRYSDTMIRPIVTRTSSLRRSYYRRSRAPRSGAPRGPAAEGGSGKVERLHPFWQPRGFWDEYSDSDSESDWGELVGASASGTRRLPPGGDTTEVGEPRGIAKIFDRPGFGRAFLVGNSLGLERAGTNRRKPVVSLPVGLGRRTSGRVVIKRNSAGTLTRQSVASLGVGSLRSAKVARRSTESLRQASGSASGSGNGNSNKERKSWDPRNWQVQYVGVGGVRDVWRRKQAEKRRRELKGKIGVRYAVENAPTSN